LPRNNIRDKCTKNVENVSSIYFDTQVNENIVNENDTVHEMSEYNDTSIENVNYDIYKQSIDYTSYSQQSFIFEESTSSLSDDSINITDSTFKNDLATWAVQYRISHIALRALLQRLKQHSCFAKLLLDARSILKTPRKQEIRIVLLGIYYHFGVLNSVLRILSLVKDDIDCIKITVNVDGLPLTKSSQQQFWPILGSIIPYNNVFMIGIYHGNEKPINVNDFLKDFVDEIKDMCENGINVNGRNIQCRLEALICDTPAKAFVLCVKGHAGYSSCTKCQTEGENIRNRLCFPQVDAPLRTDDNFINKIDENSIS